MTLQTPEREFSFIKEWNKNLLKENIIKHMGLSSRVSFEDLVLVLLGVGLKRSVPTESLQTHMDSDWWGVPGWTRQTFAPGSQSQIRLFSAERLSLSELIMLYNAGLFYWQYMFFQMDFLSLKRGLWSFRTVGLTWLQRDTWKIFPSLPPQKRKYSLGSEVTDMISTSNKTDRSSSPEDNSHT